MFGFQQQGITAEEDPFVEGDARVRVSFLRNEVDIRFSSVRSVSVCDVRTLASFGFDDIPPASDGTFGGFDEGEVEGAFLGSAHQEVAGMFQSNENHVIGSFGAANPHAPIAQVASVASGN